MRLLAKLLCVACVLSLSLPAMAKLRGYPAIESIGLMDENPLHIAVVFGNGDALSSDNGGSIWKKIKKDDLPAKLPSLPSSGEVRYQTAGDTVVRSEDLGKTWLDVSPWRFFRMETLHAIEKTREAYKEKFSIWLPDYRYWPVSFLSTSLALLILNALVLWRVSEAWLTPLLLSMASCLLLGVLLWAFSFFTIDTLEWRQWRGGEIGSWDSTFYPRWPLGVLLLLCGSVKWAPLTAALCLPLTPIFNIKTPNESPRIRVLKLAWSIATLAFIAFIPAALYYGRGDYWDFP